MDWFKHAQFIPNERKRLQEAEAAYALREGWHRVFGDYPSDNSLGVLWAKSALETGRWRFVQCYNFGNIKHTPGDKNFFTMAECTEEVTMLTAKRLMIEDPERVSVRRSYISPSGVECASILIKPGHLWSQFRAYKNPIDGAEDYIRFISQRPRQMKAWEMILQGDPLGYASALKEAGFYTTIEKVYSSGMLRLFHEFRARKDALLSGKSPELPAKEFHDKTPNVMVTITIAGIGMFIAWLLHFCK